MDETQIREEMKRCGEALERNIVKRQNKEGRINYK